MPGQQLTSISLATPAGNEAREAALAHLRDRKCYRTALSLYCRLQFGRFDKASHLITNVTATHQSDGADDVPWLYAFVDRSYRPETELWMFGSWEVGRDLDASSNEPIKDLLRALIIEIKSLGVPKSIHSDYLDSKAREMGLKRESDGFDREDYANHVLNTDIMLAGAVHERTLPLMRSIGVLRERFKEVEIPCLKFMFKIDELPALGELPNDVRWGALREEHFAVIKSRTNIPRQDSTMASVPSLAIFSRETDDPIAWAFIGLDSSLTTLHVESDFRGRGLAKLITIKLLKENMGRFFPNGEEEVAHGHVNWDNEASIRLCRSIGGKADWTVSWLRVDLNTA